MPMLPGMRELADGMWEIVRPTPYPVGPVNVYLIEDDPLTLFDAGPDYGPALSALDAALAEPGYCIEDLERIVLSHEHPDHWSAAQCLVQRSGAELCALARLARWLADYPASVVRDDRYADDLLAAHGLVRSPRSPGIYSGDELDAGQPVVTLPLHAGDILEFARRRLQVLHRPGHSRAEVVLHDDADGIMLGADHLLAWPSTPMLSTPLDGSAMPWRPRALAEYFASLRATEAMDISLILPGHGDAIREHGGVIGERLRQYEARIERVRSEVGSETISAIELARRTRGHFTESVAFFVLCETLGYLDALLDAGEVVETENGGLVRFARAVTTGRSGCGPLQPPPLAGVASGFGVCSDPSRDCDRPSTLVTDEQPQRPLTRSHLRPRSATPPLRLTIEGLLSDAVGLRPDGVALVDGIADAAARRRWTYRELHTATTKVAATIARRFAPGDHVAIWSPNSADWVLFQIGAGLAGVVLVTVNPAYQDAELADILGRSRARGLFFGHEHHGRDLAKVARRVAPTIPSIEVAGSLADLLTEAEAIKTPDAPPTVEPGAIAQIQYTSGTTGFPKGAMLTHGGISMASDQVLRRALPRTGDGATYVNPMPLFHIGGSGIATIGTLARAGTHVVMPRFDVELWLSLVEAEQATITMAVPTMLIAILEHLELADHDLRSLRTILTGGATVPRELVERARQQLGAAVLITFGQTESHGTMCTTRPDDTAEDISTTVGRPLDHVEVAVADPVSGEIVELGAPGEILIRGDQVMAGYYNAPDETGSAIDGDGWLHFGDLGTMDERGYLRVIGRLKDMIIRGGENIYPREIEDILARHPDVADVAVVGVPDDTWGEEVAAVVRLRTDLGRPPEPAELREYCRGQLAAYKSPRLWFYVAAFPLTPSGKIQKHRIVTSIVEHELRPVASFVRQIGQSRPSRWPAKGPH